MKSDEKFAEEARAAETVEELAKLLTEYDEGMGRLKDRKQFLDNEINKLRKEKRELDDIGMFHLDVRKIILNRAGKLALEAQQETS